MSHRAINDINSQVGSAFSILFICFITFNFTWQLMFDKKQKSCVKRIHLVADDGLYGRKAFYKVKIVFVHPLTRRLAIFYKEISYKGI